MEPTYEVNPENSELPIVPEALPSVSPRTDEVLRTAVDTPQEAPRAASAQSAGLTQRTAAGALQDDDDVSASVSSSSPALSVDDDALIADDADLIEKEWVIRAKAIVEQTKSDPHVQNRELGKVKAEYIKKRYNKDVKVSGE